MKHIKVMIISGIFLLFCFIIGCTNATQAKLKENPEFERNAERFTITHHYNQSRFMIGDVPSGIIYEVEVEIEDPQRDVTVLEEEERDDKNISKTKTFASHKFFVTNPWDSTEYEVIGTTTYFITKEEEESESFEVGKMEYPIEFWIFDDGKEVGKITVYESPAKSDQKIDLLIHDKPMKLENNIFINKKSFKFEKCLSFEDESGLITLISLKDKGNQHGGEMLIKKNLSKNLKSDIIAMYMIAETAFGIIGDEKI